MSRKKKRKDWTDNIVSYCNSGIPGSCPFCGNSDLEVFVIKMRRSSINFHCPSCGKTLTSMDAYLKNRSVITMNNSAVILTEEDKNFIKEKLPDAEQVLASNDVNDVLDSIADWISVNGFAAPHYYDYNDLGRKAQRVYDRIFKNN